LRAPARAPTHGFFDEVLRGDAKYALGFMKPIEAFSFGRPDAFGTPGAGGSLGYADPGVGIGYGYVTNRIGLGITPDPRDVALRSALSSVVH
jgi:CubicO group peptidase (beta-lactamase class C family)